MVSTSAVLCRQRSLKWKELILYLALRLGIKFVEWTPCKFRTLHFVAIVLSLSSISNSWLPTPCVAMSSVKSSCTPGFFPLINRKNFLSRSSRWVLPLSRRVTTDAFLQQLFPECPWVYTQGDWTFWTQEMIWLAYVFYGWHIDFKRHFKTVLSSQRCFARGCGFHFLDSFSFDVVVLVLCFVKVKKRNVCCNTTYLANRKGDYDFTWLLMTFVVNKPAQFGHLFSLTYNYYCPCMNYESLLQVSVNSYFPSLSLFENRIV